MEKDIYELHEMLEEYIRNNIFSSNLIRTLSFQFQRLLRYMNERSISLYTKEIGNQYLAFRSLPDNNRRRKETSFNSEARYITLLNGMLDDKWIIKVSRKNLDIPLPGSLGDYAMSFLEKYTSTRRLNIKTRNNYYNSLYKFCERMEFDHVTSLSDITAEKVLDFVASSQNCKDHIAIILRALLRQLYDEKIIDFRTATILDSIKTRSIKKLPSYYTPLEVMGVEATIDRKYPMGKRDYAMILLATRLGLRSSDIRFLKFSDLDWDNNLIYLEQFKTKRKIELPLLTGLPNFSCR